MFQHFNEIQKAGFTGFKTISELSMNHSGIPNEKGVYLALNQSPSSKEVLIHGSGGFFKQKNPNVSIEQLNKNWVENSLVLYIGQAGGNNSASTLRKRVKQYLDFGNGKAVGHWGGRLIWQLKNHDQLFIAWKSLPDSDPRIYEKNLIQAFINYTN